MRKFKGTPDVEEVADVLAGRLKILTEDEVEEKYNVGGNISERAELTIRIPKGWILSTPWEGPDVSDNGRTATILLERK